MKVLASSESRNIVVEPCGCDFETITRQGLKIETVAIARALHACLRHKNVVWVSGNFLAILGLVAACVARGRAIFSRTDCDVESPVMLLDAMQMLPSP